MRIAVIAPPWYRVPPSGYGGIEWVVALLADGLTDRATRSPCSLRPAPGPRPSWSRRWRRCRRRR